MFFVSSNLVISTSWKLTGAHESFVTDALKSRTVDGDLMGLSDMLPMNHEESSTLADISCCARFPTTGSLTRAIKVQITPKDTNKTVILIYERFTQTLTPDTTLTMTRRHG